MLGLQMSQALVSYLGTEERLSSLRSHLADTTRVVCGGSRVYVYETVERASVRLSVRPSIPSFGSGTALRWVYCCGPGGQEIYLIDCCGRIRRKLNKDFLNL